jgi:hypothetical protein
VPFSTLNLEALSSRTILKNYPQELSSRTILRTILKNYPQELSRRTISKNYLQERKSNAMYYYNESDEDEILAMLCALNLAKQERATGGEAEGLAHRGADEAGTQQHIPNILRRVILDGPMEAEAEGCKRKRADDDEVEDDDEVSPEVVLEVFVEARERGEEQTERRMKKPRRTRVVAGLQHAG